MENNIEAKISWCQRKKTTASNVKLVTKKLKYMNESLMKFVKCQTDHIDMWNRIISFSGICDIVIIKYVSMVYMDEPTREGSRLNTQQVGGQSDILPTRTSQQPNASCHHEPAW